MKKKYFIHVIIDAMSDQVWAMMYLLFLLRLFALASSIYIMRGRLFRPWRDLAELHEVELLLYDDEGTREKFPDELSTRRDRGIAHVGEQSHIHFLGFRGTP
jgi:hypothetical protein